MMTCEVRKALALFILFADMCFALTSGMITYAVINGGSPITPDLYGPQVHAVPALVWTSLQEKGALLGIVGAMMIASHSRWWRAGAAMAVAGNAGLACLMGLLAYFAQGAPQGIVMFAMCLCCGVPWSIACAISAALILRREDAR